MNIQTYVDSLNMPLPEDILKRKWAGDLEGAIKTLEVGIKMTDDPELKAYLAGLRVAQTVEKTTPGESLDYTAYTGCWANWDTLAILMIDLEDDTYKLTFGIGNSAGFCADAPVSNLKNDTLLVHVSDDGTGASGDVEIRFREGSVYCALSNLKSSEEEYGIAYFDGAELLKQSNEIEQEEPVEPSSADQYAKYEGSWEDGLAVDITDTSMSITLTSSQGGYAREASIEHSFLLADIRNGSLKFAHMDSWGNRGNCKITFGADYIEFEITDVQMDYSAMWAVYEGTYTYYLKDKVSAATDSPEINYGLYEGKWNCGSLELEITCTDSGYVLQFAEYAVGYLSQLEAPFSCLNQEGTVPVISFYVSDDGYGGSGTLNLYFVAGSVTGEVLKLKEGKYDSLIGFFDDITLSQA